MRENKKSSKIINLSELAFERDKKNANVELRDYFVKKNRQIKAAQLISAMKSSLNNEVFSCSEAKQLAGFLARKFDIRGPAIQYVQAGYLAPGLRPNKGLVQDVKNKKKPLRGSVDRGSDLFHELFLRLQSAVQENLLDYNGACILVRDIVISYPTSRDSLMR